jgi:ArsR family transcriptional regulator
MDDERFQRISKALADPRRRQILEMIAAAGTTCGGSGDPVHCNTLVERLPISQPTVSHHIHELHDAGLIDITPSGAFNLLSLRPGAAEEYIASLRQRLRLAPEKTS